MAASFEYLDHPGPIPFAHRGGASDAPENTLPAFQNAVDLGYRYLETDVQVTKDGVLAAFHDDDLLRTTGRAARIRDLAWSEVRRALVDGQEPIPALEDLLSSFPQARINIDCKSDAGVDALVAALTRTNAVKRVCIGAFSTPRIRRLRRLLGPDLCTSMGPTEVLRWRIGSWLPGAWPTPQLPTVQIPVAMHGVNLVTSRTVREAHRRSAKVHVWTIDDPVEMARLLDLGVDGIMTDKPAVLKEVLLSRNQWF